MRISYWSSDVCSSDLLLQYWPVLLVAIGLAFLANAIESPFLGWVAVIAIIGGLAYGAWWAHEHGAPSRPTVETLFNLDRSEERRVGTECVRTCRSRWSPYN